MYYCSLYFQKWFYETYEKELKAKAGYVGTIGKFQQPALGTSICLLLSIKWIWETNSINERKLIKFVFWNSIVKLYALKISDQWYDFIALPKITVL